MNNIYTGISTSQLPKGVLKTIPISGNSGIKFIYNGEEIVLSKLYVNHTSNCYMFDMKWDGDNKAIYGIPVRSGIDLVGQFPQSPIQNLYAFDLKNIGSDVYDYKSLVLYMIDESVMGANNAK